MYFTRGAHEGGGLIVDCNYNNSERRNFAGKKSVRTISLHLTVRSFFSAILIAKKERERERIASLVNHGDRWRVVISRQAVRRNRKLLRVV